MAFGLLLSAFCAPAAQAQTPDGAAQLERLIGALERGGSPKGSVEVSVYFPPRKTPTASADKLPRLSLLPALVRQNFDLGANSFESFLGRSVTRLELTPRVQGAAAWTFWLDSEWNTPLAFEQRSFEGRLLRRAAYTALSEQKAPAARKAPQPQPARPALERRVSSALSGLTPPGGFKVTSVKRSKRGDLATVELTYTDGLNSFPLVLTSKGTKAADGIAVRKVGSVWLWMVGSFPRTMLENTLSSVQGSVDLDGLGTFADSPDSKP